MSPHRRAAALARCPSLLGTTELALAPSLKTTRRAMSPSALQVLVVPVLSDNYAYVLSQEGSREAVAVDPGEAGPVVAAVEAAGLSLVAILQTHHHWDHVGGNDGLLTRIPALRVFGHESDRGRIPGQTDAVTDGSRIDIAGLELSVLHVPGHTRGAVAYLTQGAVFTGDTLFLAGCGRLFEGTAAELHASLERLGSLPPRTAIYCGHEYAAKNLEFATRIDPKNAALQLRREHVRGVRAAGRPSVPGSVGEESETNPFLRTSDAALLPSLGLPSGASRGEVFTALRAARDRF